MDFRNTPPDSSPSTPDPTKSVFPSSKDDITITTTPPTSIAPGSPTPTCISPTLPIPANPTQKHIQTTPQLQRFQKDLLLLTSLNENSTLHWRPSWFAQDPFSTRFWTLHNPPNVVTERLPPTTEYRPNTQRRDQYYYTRRMRRNSDAPPCYIKTWEHWGRYCALYGVPYDFLCEEQVTFMRLGLPRDGKGTLCAPPVYPAYPEPQPLGQGSYVLDPSTWATHLPEKFCYANYAAGVLKDFEAVVVHDNGAIKVERGEDVFELLGLRTYFDGTGVCREDAAFDVDGRVLNQQGPGRRWSYLPWTGEQEESCKPPKLVLKLSLKAESGLGRRLEKEKEDRSNARRGRNRRIK